MPPIILGQKMSNQNPDIAVKLVVDGKFSGRRYVLYGGEIQTNVATVDITDVGVEVNNLIDQGFIESSQASISGLGFETDFFSANAGIKLDTQGDITFQAQVEGNNGFGIKLPGDIGAQLTVRSLDLVGCVNEM